MRRTSPLRRRLFVLVAAAILPVAAYGLPEDGRRSAEAGFDLHPVKPVDGDELERALRA